MTTKSQKYTLSLPIEIYEELKRLAEKEDRSIKDVVRQCLKFGLIGMHIDKDPNSEIVFRERVYTGEQSGQPAFQTKDTLVRFVW